MMQVSKTRWEGGGDASAKDLETTFPNLWRRTIGSELCHLYWMMLLTASEN